MNNWLWIVLTVFISRYNLAYLIPMPMFSLVSWFLSFFIVTRNGKVVWKHGSYCWCFPLSLKYMGWLYRVYIKTVKNRNFCEELFIQKKHSLLLWPWCQGFWGSPEDCYRSKRVWQMLLVCYYLLNSQNIPS